MLIKKFWSQVLAWYDENARDYPWRKTSNPYHVLLAEYLLQQTNVRKVEDVYNKLILLYPNPEKLAAADLSELEDIIKPLGLVYRAKRLKKSCEIISKDYNGNIPITGKELKKLPGVGAYISDAVMCYAFGQPTVPIDTNVIRVFCRIFGIKSSKARPRTDLDLMKKITDFYPAENTREYNLAILDFAAGICTAKKPSCKKCMISQDCDYYRKTLDDDCSEGAGNAY